VRRTMLIKTGKQFAPDPDELVDIKIKLIGSHSILSVKCGSWHADAVRQEHETRFRRTDLAALIASLAALGNQTFILLTTSRSIWRHAALTITLDEYLNAHGKALFEVEAADQTQGEKAIDALFAALGIKPMDSPATIAFINDINSSKDVHIDLRTVSPEAAAKAMMQLHTWQ